MIASARPNVPARCWASVVSSLLFLAAIGQASGAQVSNVLIPSRSAPVRMISIAQFKPDLEAPDSAFECGTTEVRAADRLMPVNAIMYTAYVPTHANPRVTMSVFADSLGNVLRFAERRGAPIKPDTRGMTPSQIGAAVQAAALQSRSTVISADYMKHQGSVANRGGDLPEQMAIAAPEVIADLQILGKPGDFAARVVASCGGR